MQRISHPNTVARPSYQVTSASFAGPKPSNRGLLFYPVSLGNQSHQADKLHAAIKLIRDIKHPDTDLPNVVIHLTDGIYAFNYQIEDQKMPLSAAREKADSNGIKWVNDHLTGIVEEMGFQPIILHWSHWEDTHGEEYDHVIGTLEKMWQNQQHPFFSLVQQDVEAYVSRHRDQLGKELKPAEIVRISDLSAQFILHECAGYILIGRHIVKDYMDILRGQRPEIARIIDGHGGLQDGAFRLYPGGQLRAIDWLQKNSRKLPPEISGAGGIKPIRISLSQIPTSNENALSNQRDLRIQDASRKMTSPILGGTSRAGSLEIEKVAEPLTGSRVDSMYRRPAHHRFPSTAKALL